MRRSRSKPPFLSRRPGRYCFRLFASLAAFRCDGHAAIFISRIAARAASRYARRHCLPLGDTSNMQKIKPCLIAQLDIFATFRIAPAAPFASIASASNAAPHTYHTRGLVSPALRTPLYTPPFSEGIIISLDMRDCPVRNARRRALKALPLLHAAPIFTFSLMLILRATLPLR